MSNKWMGINVMVKGGVNPQSYENYLNKKKQDAEKNRNLQDQQIKIAKKFNSNFYIKEEIASLVSNNLDQNSPKLVLHYMDRAKNIVQDAICEITMIPDQVSGKLVLMFTLVCPHCVQRNVPMQEAQLMVRENHRKFYLDERVKVAEVIVNGVKEIIPIAGLVTCDDIIKCSNFNCNFKCRIENSKIWEV